MTEILPVTFSPKFLQKLGNISKYSFEDTHYEADFKIYILQVEPLSEHRRFVFYVGSTSQSIENRVKNHKRRGLFSWSHFRNGNYRIFQVRIDLHSQFPTFGNEKAAKKAEGLVADYMNALGFSTDSDQLKIKRSKTSSK